MLHKTFTTNIYKVEIEITTWCNLKCVNCDRSVKQAPSGEFMDLDQIQKFVDESIELNRNREYIWLIGGEPTMHPKFFDVLVILEKYKNFQPYCVIEVVTNGHWDYVKKMISQLPKWVTIRNSNKDGLWKNFFSTYNIAPVDLPEFKGADYSTWCWITEHCWLWLTRYWYYPCWSWASVDRIFWFNIGIKTLKEVNDRLLMKKKLCTLCALCWHFKDVDPDKPDLLKQWTYDEKMSATWIQWYRNYSVNKKKLTLY